ncbi:hypothetical protein DJ031_00070 [bacterium endosymbiont of Escarpia laminata]|nr:MAG: hypothetical protein DJ031_00070 [bacterium endosymbiont of Escarpia laminata]
MKNFAEVIGESILERARRYCGECESNEGCPFVHIQGYRAGRPSRHYRQMFMDVGAMCTRFFRIVLTEYTGRSLIPCLMRMILNVHDRCDPQADRQAEARLVNQVTTWLLETDWLNGIYNFVSLETAVTAYLLRRAGF